MKRTEATRQLKKHLIADLSVILVDLHIVMFVVQQCHEVSYKSLSTRRQK